MENFKKIFIKVDKSLHSTSEDLRTISAFSCCDYMRDRRTSEVSLLLSVFLKVNKYCGATKRTMKPEGHGRVQEERRA